MTACLTSPLLSVVVPAYNVERYIEVAVRSVLCQTLPNLEVIVIDDGSTDATAEIVSRIDDRRVRLISQGNGGLAHARNVGIKAARADLIGFLDGDDLWLPDKARRHVDLMMANPKLGLTYSHSIYIDENGSDTGRILISSLRRPTYRQMMRRNRVGNGSTPVVRRRCFEEVGVFDEGLPTGEDWEMWVRILRETELEADLIPAALTAYRINLRSLSNNFEAYASAAVLAAEKMSRSGGWRDRLAIREGLGMTYRVVSMKAFSARRYQISMRLLARSVVTCPWLPFVDPRLPALLAMLMLPRRIGNQVPRAFGSLAQWILAQTKS